MTGSGSPGTRTAVCKRAQSRRRRSADAAAATAASALPLVGDFTICEEDEDCSLEASGTEGSWWCGEDARFGDQCRADCMSNEDCEPAPGQVGAWFGIDDGKPGVRAQLQSVLCEFG